MPAAMTLINSQVLGSATPSITFSSIPNTYRDLRLVINWGLSGSSDNIATIRLNGDTTNYSTVDMLGQGTGYTPNSNSRSDSGMFIWRGTNDGTIQAVTQVNILDYAQTDKHKTALIRTDSPSLTVAIAGRWASTSAVTSVTILPWASMSPTGNMAVGTTAYLYGVSA